jgi:hypothetical protein
VAERELLAVDEGRRIGIIESLAQRLFLGRIAVSVSLHDGG